MSCHSLVWVHQVGFTNEPLVEQISSMAIFSNWKISPSFLRVFYFMIMKLCWLLYLQSFETVQRITDLLAQLTIQAKLATKCQNGFFRPLFWFVCVSSGCHKIFVSKPFLIWAISVFAIRLAGMVIAHNAAKTLNIGQTFTQAINIHIVLFPHGQDGCLLFLDWVNKQSMGSQCRSLSLPSLPQLLDPVAVIFKCLYS